MTRMHLADFFFFFSVSLSMYHVGLRFFSNCLFFLVLFFVLFFKSMYKHIDTSFVQIYVTWAWWNMCPLLLCLRFFSSFIVWNCNSLWSVNKMETKMYKFRVNWNDYTVKSPCMSYNEPCKKFYCVCVCVYLWKTQKRMCAGDIYKDILFLCFFVSLRALFFFCHRY